MAADLGRHLLWAERNSTRHAEEVQDARPEDFSTKLRAVFRECHRVLRDDGLLVFTYHHSRADGWTSLAEAVLGAEFAVVCAHPLKSEMSVAAPKSQAKEPIQLDVVLVCRKRAVDKRQKAEGGAAFRLAVERAGAKARRLMSCGLALSVNDRRVIVISEFLVAACAGRSAEDLSDVLSATLTDLDLAALRFLDERPGGSKRVAVQADKQLAFFERAKPARQRQGRRTKPPVARA